MAYRVVAASWPRPFGRLLRDNAVYFTLDNKTTHKEEDMHCLWKEERPRDGSIGCSDALCGLISGEGWVVSWWGMRQNIYYKLCWVIFETSSLLSTRDSVYHSIHQYDEVGIERYGQRATLINGACCSNLSSSIILTWFWGGGTVECRGLPEYGVGGHWETILFHAIANSWVGLIWQSTKREEINIAGVASRSSLPYLEWITATLWNAKCFRLGGPFSIPWGQCSCNKPTY